MTKFKIIQKKVRKRKTKTVYDDFVELGLPSKPNPWNPEDTILPGSLALIGGDGGSATGSGGAVTISAGSTATNFRYTYSIRRDFAGSVDTARLHTEIQHSLSAPLVAIETEGDHLHIIFGRTLSPHEKATLDGDFSIPGHPVENHGLPARGLLETHRVRSLPAPGIPGGGLVGPTGMYPYIGYTGMGFPYLGYTGVDFLPPAEKKEPERQAFIYASDPINLSPGGTCTSTIVIQRDADFYCDEIRIVSTGPCSLMIRDSMQDRNWFNKNLASGLMRGGLKLTIPRRVTNSSYLYLELTDTSLAANDVRIALHGYKEFPVA